MGFFEIAPRKPLLVERGGRVHIDGTAAKRGPAGPPGPVGPGLPTSFRALAPVRTALAAGTVRVVGVGDSNTEGANMSERSVRWFDRMVADLRLRVTGGDQGIGWVPATGLGGPAGFAWTGGEQSTSHFGGRARVLSGGASGTFTAAGSRVTVMHEKGTGTYTVTVGAATTTVNTGTGSGVGEQVVTAPSGSNTVTVTGTSGSPVFLGAHFATSATGVSGWNAGQSGSRADSWAYGDPQWGQPDSEVAAMRAIGQIAPHLVVVSLGANGLSGIFGEDYPATEYAKDMAALVQNVRLQVAYAGGEPPGFLLLTPAQAKENLGTALDQQWLMFEQELLKRLGDDPLVSILHASDVWAPVSPDPDVDPAGYLSDQIHWSAQGHAAVGEYVVSWLNRGFGAGLSEAMTAVVKAGDAVVQSTTAVTAAQAAQAAAASSATLAQQAQAASLEVPDANVSALIGNPVTETRQALEARMRWVATPPLPAHAGSATAEGAARPIAHLRGAWWGYSSNTNVYRSTDGVTWTVWGTAPSGQVQRVIPVGAGDDAVVVTDMAIYKVPDFFAAASPSFGAAKVTVNGAARHTRFGCSSAPQGRTALDDGRKLIVSQYGPGNPAFGDSRYAWLSLDYGETWTRAWDSDTQTASAPTGSHVHGAEYDPYEDAFYVIEGHGTDSGVWRSANDGATWTLHPGYRMYSAPTCIVATDDGLFMSSDDPKAGTLGIPRVGAPADRQIIRTWAWRTGFGSDVLGFGTQAVRDPHTGIVYASYQSSFAGQSPIIAGGTATVGGLVWSWPQSVAASSVGDELNSLAMDTGSGLIRAAALISGTRYIATVPLTRRGQQSTDDPGGIRGGTAERGTAVAVGAGSTTGTYARPTAVGVNSRAQQDALAAGYAAYADATGAIALGYQATATAGGSIAIGRGVNSPYTGTLIGDGAANAGSGGSATALGGGAKTWAFGTALGHGADVGAPGGSALGEGAKVNAGHAGSVALGQRTTTSRGSQVHMGARHAARSVVTNEPAPPQSGEVFDYALTVGALTHWVVQYPGGRKVPIAGSLGTGQDPVFTTAARPSAVGVGVGARIFDSTLGKPLWSNGTEWVDATGNPA